MSPKDPVIAGQIPAPRADCDVPCLLAAFQGR